MAKTLKQLCAFLISLSLVQDVAGGLIKTKVAILGGGMSGVIAARTLAQLNISDFVIVEARHELGGRLMATDFMGHTIELGANWVQGTVNNETGNSNPIWDLAVKHNLTNIFSDYRDILYFNEKGPLGPSNQIDAIFENYEKSFRDLSTSAGYRLEHGLIDQSAKTGLAFNNWTEKDPVEQAVEWWEFDWEYGQPPDLSSWAECVNNYNYTFVDWSEDNMFVTDQRGFKVILQNEADTFLSQSRVMFNTTVHNIAYNDDGVAIAASNSNGTQYTIEAEYAIITFSIGVLQHDASALFTPSLPDWKMESIQAFAMPTYTKLFLSFPTKFWKDSQFSLYVDPYTRGRYTVWQDLALSGFFPDANITFVTTVDALSSIVEAQPDDITLSQVLEVLKNMYPNVEIPQPNGFLLPRWKANPLFRGSYSNWPAGYPRELQMQLATPVGNGRIVFSGEATSYKYYGFLQGAYYEGIRAGEEVARCILAGCDGMGPESILKGCNGL